MNASAIRIRRLLFLLVGLLVFEGILRKLTGAAIGNYLFLAKDAVALLIGLNLMSHSWAGSSLIFLNLFRLVCVAMIPVFGFTMMESVPLALFGIKQYLLFPVIALAIPVAYAQTTRKEFRRLFVFASYLIVPVGLVALLQLRLPTNHWLNLSVGGTSLEGFSAASRLRVSGTFPFIAQFIFFMNASVYMMGAYINLRDAEHGKKGLIPIYALMTLLILSTFATGSRGAVVGNFAILAVTGIILLLKGNQRASAVFFGIIFIASVGFLTARGLSPVAFEAYTARSAGTAEASHESEVQNRLEGMMFSWTKGLVGAPPTLFGYGLGVMSNGSDRISPYAARWRASIWGETDMANTIFEGGWYLVFIWMGFRILVILLAFKCVLALKDSRLAVAGATALGYIIVEGSLGTIGIQPPLAIWFWLAVGTVFVLEQLDTPPIKLVPEKIIVPPPRTIVPSTLVNIRPSRVKPKVSSPPRKKKRPATKRQP